MITLKTVLRSGRNYNFQNSWYGLAFGYCKVCLHSVASGISNKCIAGNIMPGRRIFYINNSIQLGATINAPSKIVEAAVSDLLKVVVYTHLLFKFNERQLLKL